MLIKDYLEKNPEHISSYQYLGLRDKPSITIIFLTEEEINPKTIAIEDISKFYNYEVIQISPTGAIVVKNIFTGYAPSKELLAYLI